MSRIENTGKNFVFTIMGTLVSSVLGFISRTVFIHVIGVAYLGVNGLLTNILSMLSLVELGVGPAIAFSLYKPLANNDIPTIKSLMHFYKKAYRCIAVVITVLGLLLLPFLKYLIKDPGDIQNIPFIYLVFLYNTVISYLFSYKTTLLSADQKSYLMTRLYMILNILTVGIQLLVLWSFKSYILYLLTGAFIGTVQWFFVNGYICRRYPYLKEKNAQPLSKENSSTIATNIKAMMLHKVGDLCINQTDNVIISSLISISSVALYGNYAMIINIINSFSSSFFNSATASLGNLIAVESEEKNYDVFKKYNFLGFWVFGWTGICLYTLLNPFIEIWLGSEFLIDNLTLSFVMLNYYLVGMRVITGNFKIAAGLYKQDQWAPLVQSAINLIVSIVGAIYLGLAGVFLGTVVSSICVPCWYRPVVLYKNVFHKPVKAYFSCYAKYALVVTLNLILVFMARTAISMMGITNIYLSFILQGIVCAVIPNIVVIALFYKTEEFQYIMQLVKRFRRKSK